MSDLQLVEWSAGLLCVGALVSLTMGRSRRASGWACTVFTAAAAVVVGKLVVNVFTRGAEPESVLLDLPVFGASMAIVVDPLSALFLAIVFVIAPLSALYSVDYMDHYRSDGVSKFYPVLMLFFFATLGVLVVCDFMFFLVFWEAMTLTSYFLVTYERESEASQRAGMKYFIITHAATLCMMAAALVLWNQSGSFHFDAMRASLASLMETNPWQAHFLLVLFFLGFATKAGVLPMGDWLPDAHPVAPSGMSAVLSGALVKLGIYGLVRVFCSFVPLTGGLEIWGIVIALAGTISLFVGTLAALMQKDSKRLMAFHTIGQIGYVCLGLGVGIHALPTDATIAALGIMSGLFHALNHACFKACLFLGAGSVLLRTGRRDMDKLGGLGPQMPLTAGSSTIAALSIAGVPPLNGFASKWLIVVCCLYAGMTSPLFLVLGIVAMFVSLATLASFLKVLGSVFMGSKGGGDVAEVPLTMTVPQVVLAALCVAGGLFPQLPLGFIRVAVAGVSQAAVPGGDLMGANGWAMAVSIGSGAFAAYAPLMVLAGLVILGLVAYAIQRSAGARVKEVPVWTCGEVHDPSLVRYPASSYYLPFKHAFEKIYPAFRPWVPRFPGWLRRAFLVDAWGYLPLARLLERSVKLGSRSHSGIPQVYLLWITVGAVLIIGVLSWILL